MIFVQPAPEPFTLFIKPNPNLQNEIFNLVKNTIQFLQLNDDERLVEERIEYFQSFQDDNISFEYLENKAPFIAYELARQKIYVP